MANNPKTKTSSKFVFAIVIFALLYAGGSALYNQFAGYFNKNGKNYNSQLVDSQKNALPAPAPAPIVKKVTLLAVGDIMMHQEQLDSAYDKGTGVYDFSNYFLNINPYLKGGYIVYANLETPVAGSALKYSGYPKFNAPTELLAELKNNYFTHVSLANNHALDRGEKGLVNTIKNVEDADLVGIGARVFTNAGTMTAPSLVSSSSSSFASTSQATALNPSNYQITEKNGLKIGFLAYTYDTNGMTLPKGKKGELSYIDKNQIAKDILDLKNQKVDAIVMALHFGIEYKLEETASQRDLAQFACDNGADIILGDHPHVLEPIVYLNATSTGQNPIDRKCLVIYSLGNFISSMPNLYTDLGGILKVDISKTETFGVDGAVVSSSLSLNPDFLATWVKRGTNKDGSKYYTVLPLDADKIPDDIEVTSAELKRLEKYRDFVGTKIKAGMTL